MQKITKDMFDIIPYSRAGTRVSKSPERKALDSLEIGEGLIIKKQEWTCKSVPSSLASSMVGKKFTQKQLSDKSGWAILRIA